MRLLVLGKSRISQISHYSNIWQMPFLAKLFHYCDFFYIRPAIKIAEMKYFGPRNKLAKYLANVKFG